MTYVATIFDRTTGESRDVPFDDEWEGSKYLWSEGNYACDCNRGLLFYGPENDPDAPCNDDWPGRFLVTKIVAGGQVVYGEHVQDESHS